ncbi:MAG TPA: YggT family protein [Gaiellaceae bacterium]|nr:YggT family protein [Gaiellaceae bacterium]
MGASVATSLLPASAGTAVANFLYVFVSVYTLLIIAYVLTSWVRLPYSLAPVQRFLYDVCEPYLRLFRRFLPSLGAIDLSPIVAVLVLWLVEQLIVTFL